MPIAIKSAAAAATTNNKAKLPPPPSADVYRKSMLNAFLCAKQDYDNWVLAPSAGSDGPHAVRTDLRSKPLAAVQDIFASAPKQQVEGHCQCGGGFITSNRKPATLPTSDRLGALLDVSGVTMRLVNQARMPTVGDVLRAFTRRSLPPTTTSQEGGGGAAVDADGALQWLSRLLVAHIRRSVDRRHHQELAQSVCCNLCAVAKVFMDITASPSAAALSCFLASIFVASTEAGLTDWVFVLPAPVVIGFFRSLRSGKTADPKFERLLRVVGHAGLQWLSKSPPVPYTRPPVPPSLQAAYSRWFKAYLHQPTLAAGSRNANLLMHLDFTNDGISPTLFHEALQALRKPKKPTFSSTATTTTSSVTNKAVPRAIGARPGVPPSRVGALPKKRPPVRRRRRDTSSDSSSSSSEEEDSSDEESDDTSEASSDTSSGDDTKPLAVRHLQRKSTAVTKSNQKTKAAAASKKKKKAAVTKKVLKGKETNRTTKNLSEDETLAAVFSRPKSQRKK